MRKKATPGNELISKSLKFSPAEIAKILEAMEKAGYKEFSPYVRKVLLDEAEKELKAVTQSK